MSVPPDLTPNASTQDGNETLMLTLYIAGGALNSLRALANLEAICQQYFPGRYQIELVDIFEEPLRALADKVLITPTLARTAPAPSIRLVGDLSQTQTVVLALQSIGRSP
jgi:circadian clock protein KaiB